MEKENKELCSRCKGFCCIKSGCDYSAFDFLDLRSNALYNKLMEGNISIVSFLRFKKSSNGVEYVEPFLYLRARNTGRDVVDLLSMKTRCSLLTENGWRVAEEARKSTDKRMTIVNCRSVKPLDEEFLLSLNGKNVITAEENVLSGGFGSSVAEFFAKKNITAKLKIIAFPDSFVRQGSTDSQLMNNGITPENIVANLI